MSFASDYLNAHSRPSIQVDDTTTTDGLDTTRSLANRTPFYASSSSESTEMNTHRLDRPAGAPYIYSAAANKSNPSLASTATATPIPSRTVSPLYAQDDAGSEYSSDTEDSEVDAALLRDGHSRTSSLTDAPRWWSDGPSRRRGRRDTFWGLWKWAFRRYVFPFIPKTPLTIIFALLLLAAFAISLTHLIIYLCNPDKQPLPWRGYCTIPNFTTDPPPFPYIGPYDSFPIHPPNGTFTPTSFPPDNLEEQSPVGIFLAVFSMDTGVERRMIIRSTYASHPRSRNGAGEGDGGVGTSRTVVRFIMGKPRKEWERRIQLEMETYNDIVILPIKENMNDGKTYEFFHWAATGAWVPPLYFDNYDNISKNYSYSNLTVPAPRLAQHDPVFAHRDQLTHNPKPWVRPDFVVKADDDSFIMLAELEAHLRAELHGKSIHSPHEPPKLMIAPPASANQSTEYHAPNDDPLIYWGYLVKNRFMAGETYALSHALVDWVSKDSGVRSRIRGAEDQITAWWMRWHPRSEEIRWVRERCWIYDHPKSGTVYARGFLFPSEAKRVQSGVMADLERWKKAMDVAKIKGTDPASEGFVEVFGPKGVTHQPWVLSTVTTFHVRYNPPVPNLSLNHSIEALIEGTEMSQLTKRNATAVDDAWRRREGRVRRYRGQRVGGTTVVHSIKKHMWFLETAAALLDGDDYTEAELAAGTPMGL